MNKINLESYIRNIPDFPTKGINFKDITPLLADRHAFSYAVDCLVDLIQSSITERIDKIAAPESRGFILGATLSYKLSTGFIPIRKIGKLPFKTYKADYKLEYGVGSLFMHQDACSPGENILLVDDLLATGGTINACKELVTKNNTKVVGTCFLAELEFLAGRKNIGPETCLSLIKW